MRLLRPDGCGPARSRHEAEPRGRVALVVGERQLAQRSPRRGATPPSARSPNVRSHTACARRSPAAPSCAANSTTNGRPGASGPDGRLEVGRASRPGGSCRTNRRRRRPTRGRRRRDAGRTGAARTRDPTGTSGPTASNGHAGGEVRRDRREDVPAVEAGGRSRGSIRSRFSSARASTMPAERLGGRPMSTPLSGPIRTSPRAARMAIGSRSVPTPGSTTTTWIPTGSHGRAKTRDPAPSRIAYRRTCG